MSSVKDLIDELVSASVCRDHDGRQRAQDALLKTIAELERDAERYRWLQENGTVHEGFGQVEVCFKQRYDNDREQDLGEAIDAAREERTREIEARTAGW